MQTSCSDTYITNYKYNHVIVAECYLIAIAQIAQCMVHAMPSIDIRALSYIL